MPKAYCIGASIRHALDTMRVDWCWEQVGADACKDPDGNIVKAISDCKQLRGQRDAVIYFGYGADKAYDYRNWYEWWEPQQEIKDDDVS